MFGMYRIKGDKYGHALIYVGRNKENGNYIFRDTWNYPDTLEVIPSLVEEIKADGSFIKRAWDVITNKGSV